MLMCVVLDAKAVVAAATATWRREMRKERQAGKGWLWWWGVKINFIWTQYAT